MESETVQEHPVSTNVSPAPHRSSSAAKSFVSPQTLKTNSDRHCEETTGMGENMIDRQTLSDVTKLLGLEGEAKGVKVFCGEET